MIKYVKFLLFFQPRTGFLLGGFNQNCYYLKIDICANVGILNSNMSSVEG